MIKTFFPKKSVHLILIFPICIILSCKPATISGQRITTVSQGAYNPSISPDGSTIAVGILGKIWLLPIQGGDAKQLTFGKSWDHHPVWSRSGNTLTYVQDSPNSSEIVYYNFSTGTSRTLHARSPAEHIGSGSWGPVYSIGDMSFHPTNGRLYYVDFRSGIWSIEPNNPRNNPEQLLSGSVRIGRPGITEFSSFSFSPNGESIVVVKDTTDLWTHIQTISINDSTLSRLTPLDKIKHSNVRWNRDGTSIIYIEQRGGTEILVKQNVKNPDEIHRIELGPFNGRELALHPDGKHLVMISGRKLYRVDIENEEITTIPFEASFTLPARDNGNLIITNAKLFNGTGDEVLENATVEIKNGKISRISNDSFSGETESHIIDANGRFLMPGLINAHTHHWGGGTFQQAMVPTRGITSTFDPGSYLPQTLNLRDAIDIGILEGPKIYTSGPTIDGADGRPRPLTVANVTNPEKVRALVREFSKAEVDAIKIYAFLEPEIVSAVVDEAHKENLPVIGDLVYTTWSEALESNIDGFIHLMDHKWRFISEDQPAPERGPWAVVEPDSVPMNQFFERVASQGAMFDPTIMASSQYFDWRDFSKAIHEGEGDSSDVSRAKILANMLRTMHRHGVKWVAGTDTGPSSLLQELKIYEEIGIPNADILKTATSNVAKWLHKTDFGTIEPVKRADLILIDGNPLQEILDLQNVELVVQDGRVVLEK